jgi:hypothetical protein
VQALAAIICTPQKPNKHRIETRSTGCSIGPAAVAIERSGKAIAL